jgi:hypothetical protein
MAELLNSFFSSVFTREDTEHIPAAPDMETNILEEVSITEKMVREKIRNLKTESAAGPDEIGPKLLQELEAVVALPLVDIFRESVRTGEVPEDWKRANVTPIFKKGAKTDPGNYRPVSLTSVCCKLLESVLRDALMNHLAGNNLLNQSQHGFMPGKQGFGSVSIFYGSGSGSGSSGSEWRPIRIRIRIRIRIQSGSRALMTKN